jgi:hypothetical protein
MATTNGLSDRAQAYVMMFSAFFLALGSAVATLPSFVPENYKVGLAVFFWLCGIIGMALKEALGTVTSTPTQAAAPTTSPATSPATAAAPTPAPAQQSQQVQPQATYKLTIIASAGGFTTPDPGTYTYGAGQQETIVASGDATHRFGAFILNGNRVATSSNRLTLTFDQDYTVRVDFEPLPT